MSGDPPCASQPQSSSGGGDVVSLRIPSVTQQAQRPLTIVPKSVSLSAASSKVTVVHPRALQQQQGHPHQQQPQPAPMIRPPAAPSIRAQNTTVRFTPPTGGPPGVQFLPLGTQPTAFRPESLRMITKPPVTVVSTAPAYHRPLTITATTQSPLSRPQTLRIAGSTATQVPTSIPGPARISQQPLTVSLTPASHLTVPLAPNNPPAAIKPSLRIPTAPSSSSATIHQGKLITVPATPGGSVTIQKTIAPPQQQPRTISLPYAQAAATLPVSKTTLPVARVCPQPSGTGNQADFVITRATNAVSVTTTAASIIPAVQTAINLSTSAKGRAPPPATTYYYDAGPQHPSPQQKIGTLSLPTQPARIVSVPAGIPAAHHHNISQTASVSVTPVLAPPSIKQQPLPPAAVTAIIQAHEEVQAPLPPPPLASSTTQRIPSSPRPSILRRREGERDLIAPERPESREDESSSSGSTTLSATSSPGVGNANLSGGEEVNNQHHSIQQTHGEILSPRKKPRKQTLASNNIRADGSWNESEEHLSNKRKAPEGNAKLSTKKKRTRDGEEDYEENEDDEDNEEEDENDDDEAYFPKNNVPQLISTYRQTWKSKHNHFLRHSDVKAKEERRPTVNELANHKYVLQQVNGWKLYHLSAQMEDVSLMEEELTDRLSELQKRLEESAHSEINLGKVQEMIKANLQRSKIVRDQVGESKNHLMNIFDHKPKILDIINKYVNKRQLKKKDFQNL